MFFGVLTQAPKKTGGAQELSQSNLTLQYKVGKSGLRTNVVEACRIIGSLVKLVGVTHVTSWPQAPGTQVLH